MPKNMLYITMAPESVADSKDMLEPDKLFQSVELERFVHACSSMKKDYAVLRGDGIQFFNEKMDPPKVDVDELSYDERVALSEIVGKKIKEKGFESLLLYAFPSAEIAAHVHILEVTGLPLTNTKRLSKITGGAPQSVDVGASKLKTIALPPAESTMLYKIRGFMEMKEGQPLKEVDVVRRLMKEFMEKNKLG